MTGIAPPAAAKLGGPGPPVSEHVDAKKFSIEAVEDRGAPAHRRCRDGRSGIGSLGAVLLGATWFGCGPDVAKSESTSDSTGSSASTSATATSQGSGASSGTPDDIPKTCQPPRIECDGQCIDPMTNSENCATCGNVCRSEYIPGEEPGQLGACVGGQCEATFRDGGCGPVATTGSCDELCSAGSSTCIPNGCNGATILWEAGYSECDPNVDPENCQEPYENTVCASEHPDQAFFQQIGCDVVVEDAFAMSGLPTTPAELTQGPYAGWIPSWHNRCCCQRDSTGS